jgi:uncharacterized protein with NAD-binding domain and iron-sulfur cluster
MSQDPRPYYIERGGELVWRQPIALAGCSLQGLFLDADPACLKTVLDRYLNGPAGGAVDYRPLGARVALVFAHMTHAGSADARDRALGTMPETDVGFWILCADHRHVIPRPAWFLHYVFVDSPFAMAIGREVWGFDKSLGSFDFSGGFPQGGPLGVSTIGVERFAPDAVGERLPLLHVRRAEPGARPAVDPAWRSHDDGLRDVVRGLELPGVESAVELASHVAGLTRAPMVFLKQFRDAAEPTRACYQAVVEAPARLTTWRRGGLLTDPWEVELHDLESCPVARELGLTVGVQPARLPFFADFDFVMESATRVIEGVAGPEPGPVLAPRKQKVAVLGGGVGAMAAVWGLTSEPGWQERYDITVYQQGWRLGGKGASGRDAANHQRIEEHGLHVWFGFYENAFRMMRECYGELGRAPGTPLATWDQAFLPADRICLAEEVDAVWKTWAVDLAHTPGLPGDGRPHLQPQDYLERLIGSMQGLFGLLRHRVRPGVDHPVLDLVPDWLEGFVRQLPGAATALRAGEAILDELRALVGQLDRRGNAVEAGLLALVTGFMRWLGRIFGDALDLSDELRRAYLELELVGAASRGMLADGLLWREWSQIDDEDFRAWLARHGASPPAIACAVVQGGYQLIFSRSCGAGTALRGLVRMRYGYKGSAFWRLAAGMGEVVFAPLHEVLSRRGVRFEFFHRVTRLGLDHEGQGIATVELARQATLRDAARAYQPLATVAGLPVWPNAPLVEQLVEPAHDLESAWTSWTDAGTRVLEVGKDFDLVILGIPVGALAGMTAELAAASPGWQAMLEGVKTTQTMALQLWLDVDLPALGWNLGATVLDGFVDPFNTWADLSHLLPREAWGAAGPRSLSYLCGPMDDAPEIPPPGPGDFAAREHTRVREAARQWLEEQAPRLWPAFRWEHLHDPAGRSGAARLDAQYWRANIDPSERYVLSLPGTTRLRLHAGASGFRNLYLAGDWTRTGIDAGCVEGATISGLQAARAISGSPVTIPGERDLEG